MPQLEDQAGHPVSHYLDLHPAEFLKGQIDLSHFSAHLPDLSQDSNSGIFHHFRKGKDRLVQYTFFYCSDRQLRKHAIRFRIHIMNDLEYELRRIIEGDIRFDKLSRLLYSTDASM